MFAYCLGMFTTKAYHQPSARSWALGTTDCSALHDGIIPLWRVLTGLLSTSA